MLHIAIACTVPIWLSTERFFLIEILHEFGFSSSNSGEILLKYGAFRQSMRVNVHLPAGKAEALFHNSRVEAMLNYLDVKQNLILLQNIILFTSYGQVIHNSSDNR